MCSDVVIFMQAKKDNLTSEINKQKMSITVTVQ